MRKYLVAFLFVVVWAAQLKASPLFVSASGVWGPSVPNSTWTAPNAPWFFSFIVDSNPSVSSSFGTGFAPLYSSFLFTLNSSAVATFLQ